VCPPSTITVAFADIIWGAIFSKIGIDIISIVHADGSFSTVRVVGYVNTANYTFIYIRLTKKGPFAIIVV
jgi:hypothetical protein